MEKKQREIHFHLSQMLMLKNHVFSNAELKCPFMITFFIFLNLNSYYVCAYSDVNLNIFIKKSHFINEFVFLNFIFGCLYFLKKRMLY